MKRLRRSRTDRKIAYVSYAERQKTGWTAVVREIVAERYRDPDDRSLVILLETEIPAPGLIVGEAIEDGMDIPAPAIRR